MLSSQKPRECACVVSDQLAAAVVPIGFVWQRWLAVTRVTCVTDSCDTVGQTCVTQWDTGHCLTSNHAWTTLLLSPISCGTNLICRLLWQLCCHHTSNHAVTKAQSRAGIQMKIFQMWILQRCNVNDKTGRSLDGAGGGGGALRCICCERSFLGDHTRWRLRSHQVEILMLFCLSCRSWFPRWSDWHKCGERSQWCNWWRGNRFFLTTDGEVSFFILTTGTNCSSGNHV